MSYHNSLRIFLVGVGGQGILTASRVLGEAALNSGVNVQVGEVHGMAQRGGSVETSITMGSVHSPLIGDGEADAILSLEPLEAFRALKKSFPGTYVITNTKPIVPISLTLEQRDYPDLDDIFSSIEGVVRRLVTVDADSLSRRAGSLITTNMVMLGGLAASLELPFSVQVLKDTISQIAPKYEEMNLKAFGLGFDSVD